MTRQVTLNAGEPQEFFEVADFFRLLSAMGPLTVEFYNGGREVSEAVGVSKGYAEKFDRGTFDRVRLVSTTTQAVQFVTRLGNVVLYDAAPIGDTAIVSSVPIDLTTATLNSLNRPEAHTAAYFATDAKAAGSETIVAPGSNTNGLVLQYAAINDTNPTQIGTDVFLAKASAPGSVSDGVPLLVSNVVGFGGSAWLYGSQLQAPVFIPAGLGLYFYNFQVMGTGAYRAARWRLL